MFLTKYIKRLNITSTYKVEYLFYQVISCLINSINILLYFSFNKNNFFISNLLRVYCCNCFVKNAYIFAIQS